MFPMDVRAWINEYLPDEKDWAYPAVWAQCGLVRDKLFSKTEEEYYNVQRLVVGRHRSKSIDLPVFSIIDKWGTKLTFRYNFHNWVLSVQAVDAIKAPFGDLFDRGAEISHPYAEGFPECDVFGPYEKNQHQFTLALYRFDGLYLWFWIYGFGFILAGRWA